MSGLTFRDYSQSTLGADEQFRGIEPRRRLSRTSACLDHFPRGQYNSLRVA